MQVGALHYAGAFALATAASAGLTPLLRNYARNRNIVDSALGAEDRKQQQSPMPVLGGVAMVTIFSLVVISMVIATSRSASDFVLLLGFLAPAIVLAVIGYIDDRYHLPVAPRFFVQTIVAVATSLSLIVAGTRGAATGILWLDTSLTILWIVLLTNAMNLLDNMDGLAAGVAAIAAFGFFIVAAFNGQYLIAGLSITLSGICLGFLLWNRAPASIYMGDAGSLFLGFVLAAIAVRLRLTNSPLEVSVLVPITLLTVPLLDTALVIVSRLRRGLSPFQGGRDHISHRLVRAGLSVPGSVGVIYAFGLASAGLAWWLSTASRNAGLSGFGVYALVVLVLFGLLLRIPATDDQRIE